MLAGVTQERTEERIPPFNLHPSPNPKFVETPNPPPSLPLPLPSQRTNNNAKKRKKKDRTGINPNLIIESSSKRSTRGERQIFDNSGEGERKKRKRGPGLNEWEDMQILSATFDYNQQYLPDQQYVQPAGVDNIDSFEIICSADSAFPPYKDYSDDATDTTSPLHSTMIPNIFPLQQQGAVKIRKCTLCGSTRHDRRTCLASADGASVQTTQEFTGPRKDLINPNRSRAASPFADFGPQSTPLGETLIELAGAAAKLGAEIIKPRPNTITNSNSDRKPNRVQQNPGHVLKHSLLLDSQFPKIIKNPGPNNRSKYNNNVNLSSEPPIMTFKNVEPPGSNTPGKLSANKRIISTSYEFATNTNGHGKASMQEKKFNVSTEYGALSSLPLLDFFTQASAKIDNWETLTMAEIFVVLINAPYCDCSIRARASPVNPAHRYFLVGELTECSTIPLKGATLDNKFMVREFKKAKPFKKVILAKTSLSRITTHTHPHPHPHPTLAITQFVFYPPKIEALNTDVSVSFQALSNSKVWWWPKGSDGDKSKRYGVAARQMARKTRKGALSNMEHGYSGKYYSLVESDVIIGEEFKMRLVPGTMGIVFFWDVAKLSEVMKSEVVKSEVMGVCGAKEGDGGGAEEIGVGNSPEEGAGASGSAFAAAEETTKAITSFPAQPPPPPTPPAQQAPPSPCRACTAKKKCAHTCSRGKAKKSKSPKKSLKEGEGGAEEIGVGGSPEKAPPPPPLPPLLQAATIPAVCKACTTLKKCAHTCSRAKEGERGSWIAASENPNENLQEQQQQQIVGDPDPDPDPDPAPVHDPIFDPFPDPVPAPDLTVEDSNPIIEQKPVPMKKENVNGVFVKNNINGVVDKNSHLNDSGALAFGIPPPGLSRKTITTPQLPAVIKKELSVVGNPLIYSANVRSCAEVEVDVEMEVWGGGGGGGGERRVTNKIQNLNQRMIKNQRKRLNQKCPFQYCQQILSDELRSRRTCHNSQRL